MPNYIDPRCLGPDGELLSSADLIPVVRDLAGECLLLAISGRDSLAAWLYLREHDVNPIPYFCYTVPGLSYDDEWIDYLERELGERIIRLPHPRTYELLRTGAWQPLDTWNILAHCRLAQYEYSDIEGYLAKQWAWNDPWFCADGIKTADNLMRWRLIHQMGTLGFKKRHYYHAIWDFKTADVAAIIQRHGLKLSKSYLYFGSTGDGVDYNFLRFLRDNLPEDYERVLQLFPMADMEIFRIEAVQ